MHRKNFISIVAAFTGAIIIAVAGLALTSSAANAQCSCSAGSLLGGSCTVNCPAGFTCDCSGGLFSASCRCIPIPTPTPFPPRQFTLPPVSDLQLSCAQQLRAHLEEAGYELGGVIGEVIAAVEAGDADAYSVAENHFADSYEDASEDEVEAIRQWLREHPECNPAGGR